VTTPTDSAPPDAAIGRLFLRLLALGALIGIPAALGAAAFFALVHEIQQWLWTDLPEALGSSSPPWYLLLGLPVIGAAIVAAARVFLPGDGGHPPLEGLSLAPTPISHLPGIVIAGLGSLGFAAVLGPEAPVVAIGSILGLAVTSFARTGPQEHQVLAMAGSFAAISALFGGPLVGGVMLTEGGIGLGTKLIPALAPGFVAAAIGYVIFIGLGDWSGLSSAGLSIPNLEPYDGTHVFELALAPVVGIAVALVLAAVRVAAHRLAAEGGRRLSMVAFLLLGGLTVGLIGLAGEALGANPEDVLFSGQTSIPTEVAETSTAALLVLVAAKGLAYIVSLSCGFRGGPIFPAIFLGVGLATLPVIWFDASPTWAIAVGAAAGMASQTGLILTAMLFGALLLGTAGVDATPAAVLAAVAAWTTETALDRRRRSKMSYPDEKE
jgi:H+/Cl- antiporter ClcA